jgi:hypothetical protein
VSPAPSMLTVDQRLNLLYNPLFTHQSSLHEEYLSDLIERNAKGDLLRCWNCDAQEVRLAGLRTALGLVGVARCDRCGAWCVM